MITLGREHVTKHDHGDGTHSETHTTNYNDGSSKSVTWDTTDRNLLGGDKWESTTRTDSHGNSKTTTSD